MAKFGMSKIYDNIEIMTITDYLKKIRDDAWNADVSVWRGVVSHVKTKGTQDWPLFCVYEVVETKADDMLLPDVEVSL